MCIIFPGRKLDTAWISSKVYPTAPYSLHFSFVFGIFFLFLLISDWAKILNTFCVFVCVCVYVKRTTLAHRMNIRERVEYPMNERIIASSFAS